jgi:hypothetical protein
MHRSVVGWSLALALVSVGATSADQPTLRLVVEAEDEVYRYEPANNGAGPMWCSGSTCLVRIQDKLFASGLETLRDVEPLNNCRWLLYERKSDGWQLSQADSKRTREPCPLVGYHDGRLFLSANPTLTESGVRAGPARPEVFQWDTSKTSVPADTILPQWRGSPPFSEHSYRSFAADGSTGELILLQNVGHTHAEWAFRDADGRWAANGQLKWPWGDEYDRPQPIRICYPNVMLKNRSVHFCGVSDIVEPYDKWREYKKQLTGREWDYDFRRLFYTWADDITTGEFHTWIEIASRDKTCGWVRPCDLWVGDDQRVHVLWTERAIDVRLRKEFFPDAKQSYALNYAILFNGKMLDKRTLVLAEEGGADERVGAARFHLAPGNRLLVVYYVSGTDARGESVSENRLLEIARDGRPGPAERIPLARPMTSFFTATVRGGSQPSRLLDMLGQQAGHGHTISYVRLRLW